MFNFRIKCDNGAVCTIRAIDSGTAIKLFCEAEGCSIEWFLEHCTIELKEEEPTVKVTQCDIILQHLKEFGSISSLEAMKEYGIMRLASRINDLKNQGYPIISNTKIMKNRFGETVHFAEYKLVKEKEI
jgi:hypothetical protein